MSAPAGGMHLTVRADASHDIGYGHIRRTLAVVTRLRGHTHLRVTYLMRPQSDGAPARAADCAVMHLPDDSTATLMAQTRALDGPLLIDTHRLTAEQLDQLHAAGLCISVFDDGCRLEHYAADVVIDVAPGAEAAPYRGLPTTRFCLGAAYYPLRPEFLRASAATEPRNSARRLVVTFGGSDPDDQTARILELLVHHGCPWNVTAILGPGYAGRAADVAGRTRAITLLRDVADMAAVFATADLAISSASGTALELAHLGIPALHLAISHDQRRVATALAAAGAGVNLGWHADARDEEIWQALHDLAADVDRRATQSRAGRALIDGHGADRVARCILAAWHDHAASSRGAAQRA